MVALNRTIDSDQLSLQSNGHDIHININCIVSVVIASDICIQRLRQAIVYALSLCAWHQLLLTRVVHLQLSVVAAASHLSTDLVLLCTLDLLLGTTTILIA